jgi:hypothetical protein
MASTVTTFAVFQTLLQRSVENDAYLDTATKAALRARIQFLAKEQEIVLDQAKTLSVSGSVTENVPNKALVVGTGAGPNRVEFDPMTMVVPRRVDGTHGIGGFLPGHAGTSVLALVPQDEISLQYRLGPSDAYQDFDRTTVLDEVTWIQFAADIDVQLANAALPAIHIHAEQL